jgi:hypothetical protein
MTKEAHLAELDVHPAMQALRSAIPVDLVAVDANAVDSGQGYEMMTACHRQAIRDARSAGAALLFLSPDIVISEHALAAVVARHGEGYRAVVTTGLRLTKESFLEELHNVRLDAISSRALVRLGLPHLHQHERAMYSDARLACSKPVAAYWRVGEGLLARCFHLHPLMVDPVESVELTGTVDGAYLSRACPDFSRIHMVTDSDELQVFELSPRIAVRLPVTKKGSAVLRASRRALTCDPLQVRHWRSASIRIHQGEVDDSWKHAEAKARRFATLALWARPAVVALNAVRAGARRLAARNREKALRHARRRWGHLQKRVVREVRLSFSRWGLT